MRRPVHLATAAVVGILALAGFSALFSTPLAALAGEPAQQLAQETGDFSFDSWHSDFRLGVTTEGRSTLTTTETIVARFPDIDQNHGIRRAIPTRYDAHPTDVTVTSVTDEDGAPRDYDTDSSDEDGDDFLDVTIAADEFVHGPQTYVITYTQNNVILYPDDADDEEFYREVNGTGWDQTFGEVTATLYVDAELRERLTGQSTCFQGGSDSRASCETLTGEADGAGWRVDVAAGSLGPHEGLAMIVGFEPGTFVPRDDSFTANAAPGIGLVAALIALLGMIAAWGARVTSWRNHPGRPTIIAEYLPPTGIDLLSAGEVSGSTGKAIPAQFLSFAVRGNLRVIEAEGKNHYLLELVHANGLGEAEHRFLAKLFSGLTPGTVRDLKEKDASLSSGLQAELQATRKRVVADGLRAKRGGALRGVLIAIAVVGGGVGIVASLIALGTEVGGAWPALILLVAIVSAGLTFALAGTVRPLSATGAELHDYLEGIKMYIGLAEADRLRVLQSPQGALRSPYRPDSAAGVSAGSTTDDEPLQVLKLYERLLPFAVLFNQEKQWSKVLGDFYTQSESQPGWYAGSGAFNAAYFAAGISAFSTVAQTSWSGSAASSSSSGFGGGGSVGGGGGGGGGGGV